MDSLQIYKEKLLDLLASLNPRDRALVIALTLGAFFGSVGLLLFFMFNTLENHQSELQSLETNLQLIKVLQEEQASIKQQVTDIETSLAQNATTDLSAFLEGAATKAGFNPKEKNMQVRERTTLTDGNIQEKVFTVNLSNLTTEEFANFLLQTETSGYPLQIQTSTVKTKKRKGEKVLQLTLEIAAYKMLKEEG